METCAEHIGIHLSKCRHILNKGYTNIHCTRLAWLNSFCLEFLKLSEKLHKFILLGNDQKSVECQGQLEVVYLCLTQIVTCIKHMENIIKTEEAINTSVSAARQHFLDRIIWCLDRLRSCLKMLTCKGDITHKPVEEKNFVELMDTVLEQLSPYSSYRDETCPELPKVNINLAEDLAQALFVSKQIRSIVDLVLSHTLAFANVALKQDKKALSALCQKVLRECIAFQDECSLGGRTTATSMSDSDRKIKAISLENALYQLEDYINEALLRLVYASFLDYKKLSVEKLRELIKAKGTEDPELDELVADFDVNIDRTTQIGVFAIAFAPNVKIRTIVRSCLASFESLDSCIIPSLQSRATCEAYARLLEQHFNEEVLTFKQAIQEIIDSQAFASCYQELLSQTINLNDKEYDKQSLQDIMEMGYILHDHFQLLVNHKVLQEEPGRLEHFRKFALMLTECQAILKFAETEHVDTVRVMKRFKILLSVLRKFINNLGGKNAQGNPLCSNKSNVFIMSEDISDSQSMFASIGISPSIRSILYDNSPTTEARKRLRLPSDSLKGNCSTYPILSPPAQRSYPMQTNTAKAANVNPTPSPSSATLKCSDNKAGPQCKPFSIRRKQSLRTAMFKRQKSCESEEVQSLYRNDSGSLQISEILDQLSGLSSDFSESVLDKSIISQ